jgi:hypothetical protein
MALSESNPLEHTSMTQRAFAMRSVLKAQRETPNPPLEQTAEERGVSAAEPLARQHAMNIRSD